MNEAILARNLQVVAEVRGGRKISDDAMTVFVAKLQTVSDDIATQALRHLRDGKGTICLADVADAIQSCRSSATSATGLCVANGCPLPGTINTGNGWQCRYHRNCESQHENDAVTHVLRGYADDIGVAQSLLRDISAATTTKQFFSMIADKVAHAKSDAAKRYEQESAKDEISRSIEVKRKIGQLTQAMCQT